MEAVYYRKLKWARRQDLQNVRGQDTVCVVHKTGPHILITVTVKTILKTYFTKVTVSFVFRSSSCPHLKWIFACQLFSMLISVTVITNCPGVSHISTILLLSSELNLYNDTVKLFRFENKPYLQIPLRPKKFG